MKKITGANPHQTGPTNHSDQAVWFLSGVTFLPDDHPYVAYAQRRPGYTVEHVDQVHPEWTAALYDLKATGSFRIGGPTTDALAPKPAEVPPWR